MKNSIFKSYSKKILKSEAFISVLVVFVLAIGIIGSSYALYMDVDTDTVYQLVEVGDLSIGFNNGDSTISLFNMTPTEDDIALSQDDNIFSFYIYNTGTYTASYDIKLEALTSNEVDTQYINYQICKDNAKNCDDIKTLSETENSIIYSDELVPNKTTDPSAYYFLRVWINNKFPEIDVSKNVQLKVVIDATNASGYLDNDNTLAGAVLSNSNITINTTIPLFNGVATDESGLYMAPDDYGTSYYFRGAQSNNYVDFAGFTWRIVRINGDGTIRLILDGTLDKVTKEGETTPVYANTNLSALDSDGLIRFNSVVNDNAYVGYMYGTAGSTDYDSTHKNTNSSTVKEYIDKFYEEYLLEYESNIADTLFCGDKGLATSTIGTGNTSLGYGTNKTYYSSLDRLYYESNSDEYIEYSMPSLRCDEKSNSNYSRYTVKEYTTEKNVSTNGDLNYPIALLTADELVMAGAFRRTSNAGYYLSITDYDNYWWTMTPTVNNGTSFVFNCNTSGALDTQQSAVKAYGVRPVINLKADSLLLNGNGTVESPYEIKIGEY